MKELEPIIKYRMDSMEAKAYKIALMWEDECQRELRGESFVRLKRNSDPRKSSLFKYCFKLARETSGIIRDQEIQLYVRAQIQILKSIKQDNVHALVEPHCLVGDKAWRRWKLWKWRFDKKMGAPLNSEEISIRTSETKIKSELEASLSFLKEMGCVSEFNKISSRREDIRRWLKNGELSCFYAVLSPWAKRCFGDLSSLEFDHVYFRASVTPKIEQFFRESFAHEFNEENECIAVS